MKKEKAAATKARPAAPRAKAPKAPKALPPTAEAVAARLLALVPADEPPALWKEADLKRRLSTVERPQLPVALTHLQNERQVLALSQGKTILYLFAESLRRWLGSPAGVAATETPGPAPASSTAAASALFAVYAGLVRQSGGFPDVKIAALRAALDPASAEALPSRLVTLWREGRATLSQGDWSLADDSTRAAAVELSGDKYLLVRLEEPPPSSLGL